MSRQLIKQLLNNGYVNQLRLLAVVHQPALQIRPRLASSTIAAPVPAAPSAAAADADEPIAMANPYLRETKKCILCQMNLHPNYKNVRLLSQFQSPYTGRIYGRHITGLCRTQQERVEREISRAQRAGYMGVYSKSVEFLRDPRLFDADRPMRPHNY